MRIIPAFVHGIFDYLGGIILLAAPNIFGFADGPTAAVMVPRVIGVIVLLQSICTRYEVGLFKVLPMRVHLMNDYIASLFLAASPWLFGFHNGPKNQWMPHLIVGIAVFVLSLMTRTDTNVTTTGSRVSEPSHRL
ncbi:MAG: SPW repeat protein [Chthoniobacterales bacterium]|nr:SPW repeat protein [Chthoniobacterales bacterium]